MSSSSEPPDPGGGEFDSCDDSPGPNAGVMSEVNPRAAKRGADDKCEHPLTKKYVTSPQSSSSSVQTSFTHPDFEDVRSKYVDTDIGPFVVNFQKTEVEPSSGIVMRATNFGHFLFKNNIPGIIKDGVKRVGRNRFSVVFDSAHHANNCLAHPLLVRANYSAVIPSFCVSRMGIVRNISADWSMEEVVTNMTVPVGFGRVVKARRLSRKVSGENNSTQWIPTQSVVLTFAGRTLPPHVYCFYNSLPVECYLYPTIQCNNCCRFGHVKAQCRSKPRCYKCGDNHDGQTCDAAIFSCLFCSGNHCANNQACPEHNRQRNIKLAMSQDNLSYMEAAARYPAVRKSFAETTFSSIPSSPSYLSRPSLSSRSPPQSPPASQSYRRTVLVPRKPHSVSTNSGYDRTAHNNIVRDPQSALPNGCAFDSQNSSKEDNITELLKMILKIFSSCEPNTLQQSLLEIISLFFSQNGQHASHNSAVELPKHSQ